MKKLIVGLVIIGFVTCTFEVQSQEVELTGTKAGKRKRTPEPTSVKQEPLESPEVREPEQKRKSVEQERIYMEAPEVWSIPPLEPAPIYSSSSSSASQSEQKERKAEVAQAQPEVRAVNEEQYVFVKGIPTDNDDINAVAWNGPTTLVIVRASRGFSSYNMATRAQSAHSVPGLSALAISVDNTRSVFGYRNGAIQVEKSEGGEWRDVDTIHNAHTGPVTSLSWSADGRYFVSAGADKKIKVWEKYSVVGLAPDQPRESYKLVAEQTSATDVHAVVLNRAGSIVQAVFSGAVSSWRIATGQLARTNPGFGASALAYNPDRTRSAWGYEDGAVIIQSKDGAAIAKIKAHKGRVVGLAWSSDGRYLATAGADKTVKICERRGVPPVASTTSSSSSTTTTGQQSR